VAGVFIFRELSPILTGKYPDVFRVRIFPGVSSHLFCYSKSPGAAVPGALIPDDSGAKTVSAGLSEPLIVY